MIRRPPRSTLFPTRRSSDLVVVTARELELRNGGEIASSTFGHGDAGQVTVTADRLLVSGADAAGYPSNFSTIASQASRSATGRGGTVAITARELELRNGGQISGSTLGPGNAGQIT